MSLMLSRPFFVKLPGDATPSSKHTQPQIGGWWAIVQQWMTRHHASVFVILANYMASKDDPKSSGAEIHVKTGLTAFATELVIGLLSVSFLMKQADVPLQDFDPSQPCNSTQGVSNCPAMQQDAELLAGLVLTNAAVVGFFVLCSPCIFADFQDDSEGPPHMRNKTA
ncbi:uncharacterized protein LY89DRAFT_675731 [Mollisia scopiformis]|uniref:Uncharacterized protein n=1 Tax=Mollisia scopiformis TaxID=149040 RepID=A0A132BC25_MOLSC|nr:uncharacterized protein LY89DRAFT_675731 [Mollisia scopiformis]KUJ09559.1 hypothetical protein LY89DRAFT_675731 [Mollisia scopiformis]